MSLYNIKGVKIFVRRMYKIKPVLLGKIVQSKGRMTYFFGDLERMESAIVFWYIEGGIRWCLSTRVFPSLS